MVPRVNFKENTYKYDMLFFILYRMHGGVPGRYIWKPVYKSEIKGHDT